MCSHVTWSYNLATSLIFIFFLRPLCWKLSLPLLIPLVFKLHSKWGRTESLHDSETSSESLLLQEVHVGEPLETTPSLQSAASID